ncbi:MAG: HAD-IIA family hydrolase [Methylococcales bacterium]|nr:HAD-IIA family hydrolase [Methylococcales bacterium]
MTKKFTKIEALIIDMDGVLWQGDTPMTGLNHFFKTLREQSLPFILATNNSTLSALDYARKLKSMNVEIKEEEILTSSMVTAAYLAEHYPPESNSIFMIGEQGLKVALLEKGYRLKETHESPDADIVVCGLDRQLKWEKLATATLTLRAGARFIATNGDSTLPTERGIVPGNGTILAALEVATDGIKAQCLGKPEVFMYEYALKLLGKETVNTIAIGDRLNTDILGAVRAGIRSVMVLTGISSREDLMDVYYQPTWIMDDINELSQAIIEREKTNVDLIYP